MRAARRAPRRTRTRASSRGTGAAVWVTRAAPSADDAASAWASSFELSDDGLDGGDDRPVANRVRDGLDVRAERAIVAQPRRERADGVVSRACAVARLERREKLDRLRGGEEL